MTERVVLLDEAGEAIGTAAKSTVHHADTPLHLAFSCYVLDEAGRLLMTRRALHKRTWPGVWTNTCCGHPAPGESAEAGCRRRVREELGIGLDDLRLVLPAFRYRAVMADGVVEHEMCPVFVATTRDVVRPDREEVADVRWEEWATLREAILGGTRAVSPWCVEQVAALPADLLAAPARPFSELPPAAR